MEFMNCLATAAETIGQWGFSEGFATIMSEIKNPTFVGWLVKGLLDAVGNYGWAVVLFTVILKVITLPLDFWQRFSMKKNAKMMSELAPMMATTKTSSIRKSRSCTKSTATICFRAVCP